jgi:uncharacterized YigZ family protein
MKSYLVPADFGEAELIEKRSRFIARVWPVANEEEAVSRIKEMRERHWDATHNVYAYILHEGGIMRYSDDGEPGGTSGMPTLNVFRTEGVENACCVVTRYFGGILLGAGGLVRAYSAAAKLALDSAGISRMDAWDQVLVSCTYGQYERIRRLLTDHGAVIEHTDFGADVLLEALLSQTQTAAFAAAATDFTAGTAAVEITGTVQKPIQIK